MFEKKINDAEKKRMNKEAKKEARAAKKGKSFSDNTIGAMVLSIVKVLVIPVLFAGIVSMVIYMAMENKVAEAQLKTQVVVMKESMAQNTLITADKVDSYFEVMSVELTAVPESAYHSLKDLPKDGFYVENTLGKSQMVLKDDIAKKDEVMDKYKGGYEVTSFAAESFDGGVNGSLRRGNIVNVYALDPATELLTLMAENLYVAEVYDSSGNRVSEPEEIATSFTVYVTPEEVEKINLAVVYGGIQMYLVVCK
ncbi:MAG: hypothetical protein PHX08_07790 [Lachnospiraceae bacterium]|nr:hypothetical protein [Lachnospiraceae bacterium]